MSIKLIHKSQDKSIYSFLLKSVEAYLLNAVRRSAISLVPVMAIETVEVRKNSSLLYDEMLAHRLGLVPIKTDLKHYEMITSPGDEESLKSTVKFSLKSKGPKTVYAKDLKSSDPAVVPVFGDIPLVKLIKNQEIALEATAILGQGKEHMKWSTGIVYYKNKPKIELKNVSPEKLKPLLPEDSALQIQGNKVTVDEEKLYTTSYFDAYVGEELAPGVMVSCEPDEYIFTIESFGQLSPKEILLTSLDILKEKLEEFDSKVSK